MPLQSVYLEKNLLNNELGKLFFIVLPITFREEQIVFPVALRAIPEKEHAEFWIELSLHRRRIFYRWNFALFYRLCLKA